MGVGGPALGRGRSAPLLRPRVRKGRPSRTFRGRSGLGNTQQACPPPANAQRSHFWCWKRGGGRPGCTTGKHGLMWVAFPLSLGVPRSGRAGPAQYFPFPLPSPDITEEMSCIPAMHVLLCMFYFNKKWVTQSSPQIRLKKGFTRNRFTELSDSKARQVIQISKAGQTQSGKTIKPLRSGSQSMSRPDTPGTR